MGTPFEDLGYHKDDIFVIKQTDTGLDYFEHLQSAGFIPETLNAQDIYFQLLTDDGSGVPRFTIHERSTQVILANKYISINCDILIRESTEKEKAESVDVLSVTRSFCR